MVGTYRIASDTAWVAVEESEGVQEYAGAVYDALVASETNAGDVNMMDNGGGYREHCYEEEGVEYRNGNYATSD
ncbi:hypothetical protein PI124_g18473 [Phytophthora idaei]|nr:hypothetical protein PI125_g19619 [Phytophthora idaei]KAG3236518.1 hypothetical protein PI124_g18473 [Phytophthora idaei]